MLLYEVKDEQRRIRAAFLAAVLLVLPGCQKRQEQTYAYQSTAVIRGQETETAQKPEENGTGESENKEQETEGITGYVDISGAVVSPGVYELRGEMRLFQVIELAGGLTADADPAWINQAASVEDGQKLIIYTKEETADWKETQAASAAYEESGVSKAAETGDSVNINTADREQLMTLPGIGEARAEAILDYRQQHGKFSSVEEICEVTGIGEAIYEKIKSKICI